MTKEVAFHHRDEYLDIINKYTRMINVVSKYYPNAEYPGLDEFFDPRNCFYIDQHFQFDDPSLTFDHFELWWSQEHRKDDLRLPAEVILDGETFNIYPRRIGHRITGYKKITNTFEIKMENLPFNLLDLHMEEFQNKLQSTLLKEHFEDIIIDGKRYSTVQEGIYQLDILHKSRLFK